MKKLSLFLGGLLLLYGSIQAQTIKELTKTLPERMDTLLNFEYCGNSVSVDGDYAVVAAYGYNGYQGRAFVLYNTGTSWDTVAILTASDGEQNDYFGYSVSISGSTIVVGAYGDKDKENNDYLGAAYVFVKPTSGWTTMTETAKLTASDGAESDYFGISISISGNTIVVGAYKEDSKATNSGSAYVFEKPASGWSTSNESAKLTASDAAASDYFGRSVSIYDSTIVIGAYCDDDNGSGSGSAYVFNEPTTGWTTMSETAKLTASDGASYDYFGRSVAISDSTIVIGAFSDDDNGSCSGSAYVFKESTTGWASMTETAKLTASDGSGSDDFGYSVSISDSTIVIGAYYDNDNGYSSGSAYVFKEPTTGWITMTETAKLLAADGAIGDHFGCSVSISDNTIIIGADCSVDIGINSGSAYIFETPATGCTNMTENYKFIPPVYFNSSNYYYGYSVAVDSSYAVIGAYGYNDSKGQAYVYYKKGLDWLQVAVLTASDGATGDNFGCSVGISGNTIVVGAKIDSNSNGDRCGSAYVFEKPTTGWTTMTETAKLTSSDGAYADYFGTAVSISGSTIVVGTPYDDDNGSSSGSAYVFAKPTTGWATMTETAKLRASDGISSDFFGHSIGISDSTIVIGAIFDDDNGFSSGSAYVFAKPATGWTTTTETAKLTSSDGVEYDYFGSSVSISGNTIVIGAYYDDDNGSSSGSAYIFIEPTTGWIDMTETAKQTASDGASDNYYGSSLSISGENIVVGAYRDDDNGMYSGSAYFYSISYPIDLQSELTNFSDVCGGSDVSFGVNDNNIDVYQWQMSSDNGSTYADLSNSDIFEGADSATLVVTSGTSINNNYFRCIVTNAAYGDTTNSAMLSLETTAPVITCIGDTEASTSVSEGYTVSGTEFDLTETSDNCAVDSITNDFNNASSLAGAVLPVGTTTVVWTVTDKAGNSATCSCDIAVTSTSLNSDIDAETTINYTIFPNPTTGVVNITLGNTENSELKIYSVTGESVYSTASFAGGAVDLSGLNSGMYFIQLTTNGKTTITKLMKK